MTWVISQCWFSLLCLIMTFSFIFSSESWAYVTFVVHPFHVLFWRRHVPEPRNNASCSQLRRPHVWIGTVRTEYDEARFDIAQDLNLVSLLHQATLPFSWMWLVLLNHLKCKQASVCFSACLMDGFFFFLISFWWMVWGEKDWFREISSCPMGVIYRDNSIGLVWQGWCLVVQINCFLLILVEYICCEILSFISHCVRI